MAGNNIYVQGSYIDVHDNGNVYLSVDKADVRLTEGAGQTGGTEKAEAPELPEPLRSEEAETIWHDLRKAGFIGPDGYGLAEGVSANQATYIADRMASRLGIVKKWKVFGQLWGIRNMAQLAGSWQQTGKLPPGAKEIDKLI